MTNDDGSGTYFEACQGFNETVSALLLTHLPFLQGFISAYSDDRITRPLAQGSNQKVHWSLRAVGNLALPSMHLAEANLL